MSSMTKSKIKIGKRKKIDIPYVLIIFFLTIWGIVVLYPFYNSILVSLVPQKVFVKTPFLFYPKEFDFSAYQFVFAWKSVLTGFRTTLIVTIVGCAYNILLTVLTAYALTKKMPGRKIFSYIIILTLYLQGGLIPYYLLIRGLHLTDKISVMILPTGITIMYMMIMKSYFLTLPKELEESAKLDGANDITILFQIILPLSLPMLATIMLYYGVDRWNEWWYAMLFVRATDKRPLQLLVRNMLQASTVITDAVPASAKLKVFPQGIQMATVVVTMFPIMCAYPFLQKYFMKGLVLGSVKM